LGTKVGAVVVYNDRIVSTGYNGTPSGFANCKDGGCVRCRNKYLPVGNAQSSEEKSEKVSGDDLDICICVHAEQNAILTAARFGIALGGSVLYSTTKPCFGCLKESLQAGIFRIVFLNLYEMKLTDDLKRQYVDLTDHLPGIKGSKFEQIELPNPR
jgi:dCMP deaminase